MRVRWGGRLWNDVMSHVDTFIVFRMTGKA